jgi:hypothetical protein
MAVIIDGSLGVTTPAESVTGTGVWSVGGSQIYKDALGNVGIGTSSPSTALFVSGPQTTIDTNVFATMVVRSTAAYNATPRAGIAFSIKYNSAGNYVSGGSSIQSYKQTAADGEFANGLLFTTQAEGSAPTERARIDSSGNLLVGVNSTFDSARLQVAVSATNSCISTKPATNVNYDALTFRNSSGTYVGYIGVTNTTTSYVTSSDYRLKNTIAPMTGALAKVALLKPVTYKWNADGSDGQGFIAHELAEVEPGCVSGAKDAVDAEGKPQYQGIDTSFLVATLTAAIQELKAIIDTQATRIQALEAK